MERLRLDGAPLHRRRLPRLQRRITTADWQDLGYWLVILASQQSRYAWARELMNQRLMAYLYLICVQPALSGAETWLYPLLDYHFCEQHLTPVEGWPTDIRHFRVGLNVMRHLPLWMMDQAHVPAEDRGKVEFGYFIADEEAGRWAHSGYGFYFDVEFNRLELKPQDRRFLSPPLQLSLADLSDVPLPRARQASRRT